MLQNTIEIEKLFNKSNLTWLRDNTIYVTIHGSHAYGLSRPDSDLDLRGIVIPPKRYYLGVISAFNQAEFSEPYDCVLFGINKFVKLALECNPNIIELLYTSDEDHVYKHPIFNDLLDVREQFLSKKARFTFAGYARSQILRIKRHRKWILNPVEQKPNRKDYGLPENNKLIPTSKLQEIEAQITKKVNEWNFDSTGLDRDVAINIKNEMHNILVDLKINQDEFHMYAARSIGLDDNLLECFRKERAYNSALKEWKAYQTWKKERNRKRYELEKRFHYDVKHGMHLVRLYKQCIELLSTGNLIVKRPDADELLEIRNGAWSYDELIEWADKQDHILNDLYKSSTLRKEPNRKVIDDVLISIIEKFVIL